MAEMEEKKTFNIDERNEEAQLHQWFQNSNRIDDCSMIKKQPDAAIENNSELFASQEKVHFYWHMKHTMILIIWWWIWWIIYVCKLQNDVKWWNVLFRITLTINSSPSFICYYFLPVMDVQRGSVSFVKFMQTFWSDWKFLSTGSCICDCEPWN